jgi:hypothetical protein
MGSSSDKRPVVRRNVVMRRIPVLTQLFEGMQVISCVNHNEHKHTVRVSVCLSTVQHVLKYLRCIKYRQSDQKASLKRIILRMENYGCGILQFLCISLEKQRLWNNLRVLSILWALPNKFPEQSNFSDSQWLTD